MSVRTVTVELGERSYDVLVGRGAHHRLPDVLPAGAKRAAVVTQSGIGVAVDPGVPHEVFLIGDGEQAKVLATVEQLCSAWSRWGLTRADVVVAVGGGVVTDVAGFAAAVYHRGVPVVHVPTTLLGMVDAAIGGKTGVNLPEGKNLVGAFWQPAAVICDTDALVTLPDRERRSGLGELAKYHFLTGRDLDALDLDERIAAAASIKAEVVSGDERETSHTAPEGKRSHTAPEGKRSHTAPEGKRSHTAPEGKRSHSAPEGKRGRAILNYGHTLAHALETAGAYDLRHGEAVAIGLVYAAQLAERLGRIDDARVRQHRAVVAGYDLPTNLPPGADLAQLVDLMHRDKKATDGLTFVLDGPGGVEVVGGVDPKIAAATLEALR